jgi:2,3-bisphosphoglycerate-dependent phosphoglycerate mutase
MRNCCLLLLLAAVFTGCAISKPVVIFMVRHADRPKTGANTDTLTEAGHKRAGDLKHALALANIDTIYVTEFRRTHLTADSLRRTGIPQAQYASSDSAALVTRLMGYKDRRFLIAGHSNTVPKLIKACGCTPPSNLIPDNEFDNLFQLIIQKERSGNSGSVRQCRLVWMKYGVRN